MSFASSILMNDKVSTLSSDNTISSIKEMTIGDGESYLYSVLEFNEKMHNLEIEDKIAYYRALVESINGNPSKLEEIHESMVVDGIKRIVKFISTIIDWVREKLKSIFEINAISQGEFNMKKKISKGFVKDVDMEKEYTFTCYNYPLFNKLDSRMCDDALKEIFEHIDDICSGRDLPEVSDTTLKVAYSKLAKTIEDDCRSGAMSEVKRDYTGSREDKEGFAKFIRSNIVFTYRERMPYYSWKDRFIDTITDISKTAISDKMKYITDKLENAREKVSRVETLDDLQRKNLNTYLSQVSSIIRSYEWFLYYIMNMRRGHMKEVIRVYNNIVNNNTEVMSEAGTIHGEVFDSDTLFDNEDARDFNRTEWIDLKLEAEFYQMRYNISEEYKMAAIREAVMRAREGVDAEKYALLEALNAQTWQKTKMIIEEFIKNIVKFLDQAIAVVIDKLNPSVIYVKTHDKTIRGNRFAIRAKSKIDIFNGINRVREDIRPVQYDYKKMKGDLESVDSFFKKYILPDLERSSFRMRKNVAYNDNMGINDYMRQYYGLPYGNNPEDIVFSAEDLEKNKAAMLEYIGQPNKLFAKFRSELSQLEMNAKRAAANMSKPAPAPKSIPEKASEGGEAKQEAVYSFLYNTWLTEATVDVVDKNGNIINTDEEGSYASEQTAIQNYLGAYKLVYTARINACRSIISEFANIMKAHVQHYSQKDKKPAQNTNAQTQQQTTNPKGAPNPTPAG